MLKKIFKLIRILRFIKFLDKKNISKELIILDEGIEDLQLNVLKNYKFFWIRTRYDKIQALYVSQELIIIFLKNFISLFFNKNIFLQEIYLLSLIETLNPKVVFTLIDNNFTFSKIAMYTNNKNIKFIALQGGARYIWQIHDYIYKKKLINKNLNDNLFVPTYLCLGKFDHEDCIKYNIKINKFIPVGSLSLANFLKSSQDKSFEKIYDICLISDHGAWMDNFEGVSIDILEQVEKGYIDLIKWTIDLCIIKKFKFIFAFKRNKEKNPEAFIEENQFYKKHLSKEHYDFLLKNSSFNNKKDFFNSYKVSFKSKLIVAVSSTLLRENLSCGNKILSCNLTGSNLFDFPISGICTINNCSFDDFKNKIEEILYIDDKTYFSKISKNKNYLIHYSDPDLTLNSIREQINLNLY
jgi:surface carbohydrate biosynthesis protein